MTKYLDYKYVIERLERNHYTTKTYQDALESLEILKYQYTVYGNHTTKQIMESYSEYQIEISF